MDVHNARRRALGGAGNGRFVALLLALLGAALTALVGPPAAGATVTATPLQVGASTYDDYPTATATVEVWDRFANGHWIVHAQPRSGGATVRVNAPRTYGYAPSVIPGTESVIYQQYTSSTSGLVIYNVISHKRNALGSSVNTAAWEYWGVASRTHVAFMRETTKARELLLDNRRTGRNTVVATVKRSCSSCLQPTWVGASHLVYNQCSPTTFACQVKVLTIGGATVTVPRDPAPWSNYSGSLDEATGDVYYVGSTSYCGLFAGLDRWNIDGGAAASRLYDFGEGIDGGTTSLVPDITTPTDSDMLFSQYDCIAGDSDNYQIASANQLTPIASPTVSPLSGTSRPRRAAGSSAP